MMEEKIKSKSSNVILTILIFLLLALGGFIVYDKLLKMEDVVKCPKCEEKECQQCDKCEKTTTDYTNVNIVSKAKIICTIDMMGLTEVNVEDKCGEDFDIKNDEYQIRVTNLKYNDIKYTFTYLLEKDTIFPRTDDAGIVKMYIGDTLISARDASVYNIFSSIKTNESGLQVKEGARTSVPKSELNFNLSKIIK